MAAIGVAGGVSVVLEQVDHPADALFAESGLRRGDQALEDPFTCLVVRDEVLYRVTFGGRVLGMAAHVQVQPRPVLEKDIARRPQLTTRLNR